MKFTLTIDCDNAAFEEYPYEVADILQQAARKVRNNTDAGFGGASGTLYDSNGNTVGHFELAKDGVYCDGEVPDGWGCVLPVNHSGLCQS